MKPKSETMWMAKCKTTGYITLQVRPQWSRRLLFEWMENSAFGSDWKKYYKPVRVEITPAKKKKEFENGI